MRRLRAASSERHSAFAARGDRGFTRAAGSARSRAARTRARARRAPASACAPLARVLLRERAHADAAASEWRLAASALALLALGGEARGAMPRSRRRSSWRSVDAPVRGGEISALAFDAASATLAIGDVRGVLVGPLEGAFERRLRRGPVRDLAFLGGASGGSLLAATARGLFLLEPGGAVTEVSPGPGPTARAANRLAVAGGWIARRHR